MKFLLVAFVALAGAAYLAIQLAQMAPEAAEQQAARQAAAKQTAPAADSQAKTDASAD